MTASRRRYALIPSILDGRFKYTYYPVIRIKYSVRMYNESLHRSILNICHSLFLSLSLSLFSLSHLYLLFPFFLSFPLQYELISRNWNRYKFLFLKIKKKRKGKLVSLLRIHYFLCCEYISRLMRLDVYLIKFHLIRKKYFFEAK